MSERVRYQNYKKVAAFFFLSNMLKKCLFALKKYSYIRQNKIRIVKSMAFQRYRIAFDALKYITEQRQFKKIQNIHIQRRGAQIVMNSWKKLTAQTKE
jgi:hypothetical protein